MTYEKFIDTSGNFGREIHFLAQAVEEDEMIREFFKYIYMEPADEGGDITAVATNGHHLHTVALHREMIDFWGVTPGYWRVLRSDVSSAWIARLDDTEMNKWEYPAWRNIIPQGPAVYETTYESSALGEGSPHHNLSSLFRGFPKKTPVDIRYLFALGDNTWKVEWYGPEKAVKFTEGARMALIMPMRED